MTVETVAAADLVAADVALWAALQAADPLFASPLLSPWFAMAVGRVRDDASVSIFRRGDRTVGFFAHHRRPGGFGRPIGAPFADYHGLVSERGAFDASTDVVGLAGLKVFRHGGLVDPHGVFPVPADAVEAFSIDLTGTTPDAYLEARRAASPKKFKNYRRLLNRLRELGPLSLRADTDLATFETLLRWKRDQFHRTGAQDVLRPAWATRLMRDLFEMRQGPMTGLMLTLRAGDRLVGGHFGVRQEIDGRAVFHPWIASTDPDLAAFSPGNAFLDQAVRAMPELGLSIYDLGVGHDHYKRPFAASVRRVGAGLQPAVDGQGVLRRAAEQAWRIGPLGRSGAVGKVRRRLDHIATIDTSIAGRMLGLVEAAKATRRRALLAED
ncbi:GNAT family N-acetyltransferase [Brevundimonas sp. VNH65]|uniref:GNAT family N-acetyltransferase n=1 Tax=Brevundimonas sp. VNH65 TaxID=3400917 RepID=UPI003C30D0ED